MFKCHISLKCFNFKEIWFLNVDITLCVWAVASFPGLPTVGVSNRWTGIWSGTMEWKMEWNNKHTQL